MTNQIKRTFTDLFKEPQSALHVKFDPKSDEVPTKITIQNKLKTQTSNKGRNYIQTICKQIQLKELSDFYQTYDGFELAIPIEPKNCVRQALLKVFPATEINHFTNLYLKGGKFDWTIDLNKTKNLYRDTHSWIAFAQINDGPSCLTTFLDGEDAGNIYLLEPEPEFNILKPIAKGFNNFLDRIAKEPAEFLKLTRACVLIQKPDGFNYGYVPVKYFDNINEASSIR